MKIEVVHTFEFEVDDRITFRDLEYARYEATDCRDGRQPLSFELSEHGAGHVAENFAYVVRRCLASRISAKYPGAEQRTYKIEAMLPEPKLRPVDAYDDEKSIRFIFDEDEEV